MAGQMTARLATRIRNRREQLDLTQKKLAEFAGFPVHQIISQIETGERDVKAWELSRLAKALHVSVADLLSEAEMAAVPVVLWRKPPADVKALREADFTERCRRYAHVERLCGMPTPKEIPCASPLDLKQCSFGQVAELAAHVTRHLGLGDRPAPALVTALEERLGVKVWYFPMGDDASAACACGEFGPAILMNASEAPLMFLTILPEPFPLLRCLASPLGGFVDRRRMKAKPLRKRECLRDVGAEATCWRRVICGRV